MNTKEVIKKNGVVIEMLMGSQFRVELDGDKSIAICTLKNTLRTNNIKVLLGDKVQVEFSPYDLTRGRISYRYK
jgi:translation initiation factor IF-1